LNAFDREKRPVDALLPSATDPATIGHQHVTTLLETAAASSGSGPTEAGSRASIGDTARVSDRQRVTTDDGLVNQNVASLLEDDDGSLWIGTAHGLSRFDPD
jgi:ligand-binding sensor domain-containing protein